MEEKSKKNQRGITLVALILTVIVLLILLGVTFDIAVDGKLIDSARTAVGETNDKVAGFESSADRYGSQLEQELISSEQPKSETLKGGTRANVNTKHTDANGKTAIIPKGFTLSGIASEQTVDGGLVIYDIPASKVGSIDWTDADSVKTKYNQFVWIPVTNMDDYNSEILTGQDYEVAENGYKKEVADYQTARASVEKNGGFYIGRYEAGTTVKRTKNTGVTDVVVVQDAYPYNYVLWGTSMSEEGTSGAAYLSKQLYTGKNEYGVISQLLNGSSWNATMVFANSSDRNVNNSLTWGNYETTSFIVDRGSYCSNNLWYAVKTAYLKPENSPILLTTGASGDFCSKNIYDLAGNCHEWLLRGIWDVASQTNARPIFGGGCDDIDFAGGTSAKSLASMSFTSQPLATDKHYCVRI